jgi:hypothetical protein
MNPQEPFELGPGRFDPPPLPLPAPVPVIPLSRPAPVLPVRRPPILTAMAVASIVVALVSIVAYVLMGLQSLRIATRKPPPPPVPPSPPPAFITALMNLTTPAPPPPTTGTSSIALDGLDESETDIAVRSLSQSVYGMTFDLAQKQQLEHFLSAHGRRVFPRTDGPVTEQRVESDLQHTNGFMGGKDPGHTNFILRNGTLTIYHDRAAFSAEGSDQPLVTTVDNPPPASARPGGTSGYGALTAEEAGEVVTAINRAVGGKLNAAQVQTLMQELQSPQQNMLEPSYIPTPLSDAAVIPDGTALIHFSSGGTWMINRNGELPATRLEARIAGRKWLLTRARPYAKITGYYAAFGMVLAMMLFASAVEVLRQERLGLQLHQIWAWVMIPLGLGSCAWAWIEAHQLLGQPLGNSISRDPQTIFLVIGGGLVLLTWIYPIIVLSILRKRAIRDYSDSL